MSGQKGIVVADAAYASCDNLTAIQALGSWYVMALPRTRKFANGKALNALVTHWSRWWYTQLRMPPVNRQRRRTFWVYAKRTRVRHLGEITVVLSICRRNDGPEQLTILVTNRPESVPAREIIGVYRRRWWIERLMKELKGVVGLGQHQVTKTAERFENSITGAIMAYLLLLKLRAQDIPADRPWSALGWQRAFAWEVIQTQCERSAYQKARKWLQMAKAASYHTATCHF